MIGKAIRSLCIALGLAVLGAFFGAATVSAKTLDIFGASSTVSLSDKYVGVFSQNNLTGWNPDECTTKGGSKGGVNPNSCFKINSSVDAQDLWYAEGQIGAAYASVIYTSTYNDFLVGDTQIDEDFGGLQYIYAENYDIEYDGYEGWIPKFTKKSDANSTQKYYWIVLPSESYSNGFGETYVATFEKLSEPVYFITYDTHGTEAEVPARYKSEAEADPNGVEIGEEFFGALAKGGGNYTEAVNKAGKLTSFCRINGRGEVLAASNGNASNIIASSGGTVSPTPSSSTPSSDASSITASSEDGSNVTIIGDSMTQYDLEFYGGFLKQKLPNADIHYQNGKSFKEYDGSDNPGGLTILKQLADQGSLRRYLVFALGSNNGPESVKVTQDDIDKLLDYAKNCDKIILLTNYKSTDDGFFDNNNKLFKQTADSNDKVVLIDWKAEASKDPDKYIAKEGDFGIHPTKEGAELRANRIYEAITSNNTCTTFEGNYPQYVQATDHTCGQASMAMLATVAAGADITEDDVIRITGGDSQAYASTSGSGMAALDQKVAEEKGFTVESVNVSGLSLSEVADKMKEYLNNGYMIHMSGCGSMISPTGDCHYTGMFKLNGDKVLLADPAGNSFINREVDLKEYILSGYHGDAFSAIKGKSGGSTKCDTGNAICDNGSGSSGGGGVASLDGLDDAAIESLANNYNNNKDNWDQKVASPGNYCIGGPGEECASRYSNCTLFSAFFVEMFTDVDFGNGWGYGGNMVNQLGGMGFPTGNEPKAFSVFSYGATDWGHTGVVVRVDGDTVITAEAGYPNLIGSRITRSKADMEAMGASYAYLNDRLDMQKLKSFIGN